MNQTAPYWVTTQLLKELFEKNPDLTVRETPALLQAFEAGINYAISKEFKIKKVPRILEKK